MKPTPLGAFLAAILSSIARVLGVVIFYALRIIYRPRERAVALAIAAGFAALVALAIWIF